LAGAKKSGIFATSCTLEPEPSRPKAGRGPVSGERSRFVYKMIQIPPTVTVQERDYEGAARHSAAADYLENVVNGMALEGWDFYRVDSIGVRVPPGCVAGLLGAKAVEEHYYVATFRRSRR
jgi:hypothetical protein